MRKVLTIVCLITFGVGCLCFLQAREWSEAIQMTNAGDMIISGQFLTVETDSHDDVHAFYTYRGLGDEFEHIISLLS